MSPVICRNCGDRLRLADDVWIHLTLPIGKAWTHPAEPVEAGSGDGPGGAGAGVPARPYAPTSSGGAAARLSFDPDDARKDAATG